VYQHSIDTHEKIKYDYKLNMNDHTELTCEEVAFTAYEKASQGTFIIPAYSSRIDFKNTAFIEKLGLVNGLMMMPNDMEFDPRFDTVLEWSEYTLLQDSLRKDEIMKFILKRIENGENILTPSFKSRIFEVLWATRNISFLWPLSAKILGLDKDFDPEVPVKTLKVSLDVDSLGKKLLNRLYQDDKSFYQVHKRWMIPAEMNEKLQSF
jgi:hypothetical protein